MSNQDNSDNPYKNFKAPTLKDETNKKRPHKFDNKKSTYQKDGYKTNERSKSLKKVINTKPSNISKQEAPQNNALIDHKISASDQKPVKSKFKTGKLHLAKSSNQTQNNHEENPHAKTNKPSSSTKDNKPSTTIRLNKRMTELGLCSRREADKFIEQGFVYIDDELANHPGQRVSIDQIVELRPQEEDEDLFSRLTIILNKPVGFVSGTPEEDKKTALSLIHKSFYFEHNTPSKKFKSEHFKGLAPCGRLDINSEGLIVFSNDGRVAKAIIAPDNKLDKEYLIRFIGECSEQQINQLRFGLELDNQPLKPAKIDLINENQLRFTLQEGKKRQIRRMCDLVGIEIDKLQRVRVGPIKLGQLPLGKWRDLSDNEISEILNYQNSVFNNPPSSA